MTIQRTLAGLLFATGIILAPRALHAQAPKAADLGGEHRYKFSWDGELSAYNEKVLTESFSAFDPEIRMAVDRPTKTLKLLAYVPLDQSQLQAAAASIGVALRPAGPGYVSSIEPEDQ